MAPATDWSVEPTSLPHALVTQSEARERICAAALQWQPRSSGLEQPAAPPAEMRHPICREAVSVARTTGRGKGDSRFGLDLHRILVWSWSRHNPLLRLALSPMGLR